MRLLGTSPYPNLESLGDSAQDNPSHIWIEPTNRCNTRCRHCQHFSSDFGADMPADLFAKIQDAVLDSVCSVDLVGYGEPLVAPLFDHMLDECLARKKAVGFITNGILLRDDRRVAQLVRQNVRITVSIEGARAETHEFLRPYVKWPGMLETLECLKRNADAAGAEKRYSLGFNFVACRHNIADLPDLVLLAAKYGATCVSPIPLLGSETGHNDLPGQSLVDAPELLAEPLRRAMRLAAKHRIEIGVMAVFREMLLAARTGAEGPQRLQRIRQRLRKAGLAVHYLRRHGLRQTLEKLVFGFGPKAKAGVRYCRMPWSDTYVAADGAVCPCCGSGERMGDLNRGPWPDIWNGPLYRSLRRTIHSWNPSAGCRYCGMGMGINGGNDRQYERFFGEFRAETVPLDSPGVVFGEGFSPMESWPDGTPSHRWMGLHGVLELPKPPGARFVRLGIIPRQPIPAPNPGRCRIVAAAVGAHAVQVGAAARERGSVKDAMSGARSEESGAWEPFDNTCPDLHFPIGHVRGDRMRLEIEMETAPSTPEDSRPLGLAISGVAHLFPR
jgi:MoaA/NifB/PqqE/SkfB family radical SAM enzyme